MKTLKTTIANLIICVGLISVSSAQVAEIPFKMNGSHIFFEAKINDETEPRTFIFDTGATNTVIDSTLAEKLGLESDYEVPAEGVSGTKNYHLVLNQSIALSNSISISEVHFLLNNLSRLSNAMGKSFAGIIGNDILKNYVTQIDFDNQKILLFKTLEKTDLKAYSTIPFNFDNGIPIPQFEIGIELNNGDTFNGRILFDVGAGLNLLINSPFTKNNNIDKKIGKTITRQNEGLTSENSSKSAVIKALNIGEYRFENLVVGMSNATHGVNSFDGYMGLLGTDVIKRFNIILDYSSTTLYLKPNKHFNDPFEFPVGGIALGKKDSTIIIRDIVKESDAFKTKLKTGDKIISINGYSGNDIEHYRELLKKEGTTAEIVVENSNKEQIKVSLKLERLL